MAYNVNNEKREEIATIEVNGRGDFIKVAKITKPNGSVVTDVRVWYTPEEGGLAPTKKGMRISSENLPEVTEALMGLCGDGEALFASLAKHLLAGSSSMGDLQDILDEAEKAVNEGDGTDSSDGDSEFTPEDFAGIED